MKCIKFLFALALCLPVFAFPSIVGKYRVYGTSSTDKYKGVIEIKKKHDVYTATWTYDDGSKETGTGVRKGEVLAIVFKEDLEPKYGVQTYKIEDNELSAGPWAWFGVTWKGYEKLKKIH